ncbi:hypothetical protein [Emticicia sp.]|uniref:hypothetical protein n=1 Tax=Emticicia sp. TaxID=1930953 RepID=UPI0037522E55
MPIQKRRLKCDNLGEIKRLRLGLLVGVEDADFQSMPSQNIVFKAGSDFMYDAKKTNYEFTDLEVSQDTENGIANSVNFSLKIYNDILVTNYDLIYRKLEGRLLVAEITTMNDAVRVFAPLMCNYSYKQGLAASDSSYYEFNFRKVAAIKFEDYIFPKIQSKLVGTITSDTVDSGVSNRLIVRHAGDGVYPNIINNYKAGFSLLNDISTVLNWYSVASLVAQQIIIPNAPNNTKVFVFLKSNFSSSEFDSKEYTISVLSYSIRSRMISLEPNKPAAADLQEYDASNVALEDSSGGGVSTATIIISQQLITNILSGTGGNAINFTLPTLTGGETDTNNRTLVSIGVGISIFKNGVALLAGATFTKTDIITFAVLAGIPTTNNYTLLSYKAQGTLSGDSNTALVIGNISQVTNTNQAFELTTLQNIIDANPDVPINRFNLNDFPSTPVQARGDYALRLINADSAEYLDSGAIQLKALGLATGFNNNRLHSKAEITAEDRNIWIVYLGDFATGKTEAQLEIEGGNEFLIKYNGNVDKNGVNVHFRYSMVDIEEYSFDNGLTKWTIEKARAFMRGFQNKALEYIPNHVYIHYGLTISGFPSWGSGFGYDGDNVPEYKKYLPYAKPSSVAKYRKNEGLITGLADKGVLFSIAPQYLKAPLVMTQLMYKKVGGNFVLNAEGDRELVDIDVDETYRGITHRWNTKQPGAAPDIEGSVIKRHFHELHLGIWGIPMIYSQCVYSMQMLANEMGLGYDVSNMPAQTKYGTVLIVRDTLEANSWQNTYRPQDHYSSKAMALMGFIIARNHYCYGNLSGTYGLTNNGSGVFQAVNEGNNIYAGIEPYSISSGTGFHPYHNGKQKQAYGISYNMKKLSRDYGFGATTDKLLLFTDPQNFQIRSEIVAFGLMQGSNVYLACLCTELEIDEAINVKVSNRKNGVSVSFFVPAKKIIDRVVEFPTSDVYETKDIFIEYTSIRGVFVKVTGNLMFHDVNPT